VNGPLYNLAAWTTAAIVSAVFAASDRRDNPAVTSACDGANFSLAIFEI
jgi:hypothetical protein